MTAISAQDLLTTRDCVTVGCPNTAEPGSDKCRQHRLSAIAAAVGLAQTGVGRSLGEGRAVGDRAGSGAAVFRGEPERADPSPSEPSKGWSRKPKTREEVLEAIRAFHVSNGRPPIRKDGIGVEKTLAVGAETVARLFGSFDAGVKAAGLAPAQKPGAPTTKRAAERKAAKSSGSGPEGPAADAAEASTAGTVKPPARSKRAVASRAQRASAKRASLPEPPPPPEPPVEPEPEPERERDPRAFAILDLLALIQALDRGDEGGGGITITRWSDGQGQEDIGVEALVRRLARAALDEADPADLGRAVLAQLDEANDAG